MHPSRVAKILEGLRARSPLEGPSLRLRGSVGSLLTTPHPKPIGGEGGAGRTLPQSIGRAERRGDPESSGGKRRHYIPLSLDI